MIGERVRHRREELGLTGAQLAARAGMAPSAVSQIETGRRSPSSTSVIKLADALGVEAGELFPKVQPTLPLDLEQRRESAQLLMDAGISEATARGVSGGRYEGQPFREVERASSVFVRQEGRWQCVLTHLSKIADA